MKPKYTRKQLVEIVNAIHALQIAPIIRNMIVKDLLATKPKTKSKCKHSDAICSCNGYLFDENNICIHCFKPKQKKATGMFNSNPFPKEPIKTCPHGIIKKSIGFGGCTWSCEKCLSTDPQPQLKDIEPLTLSLPILEIDGRKVISINLQDWEYFGSDLKSIVYKEKTKYGKQPS